MVETQTSRGRTLRPRARADTAQGPRRASSVPAGGSSKSGFILDCVLVSPRKRKRTSTYQDLQSHEETHRPEISRSETKKLPRRTTRSQTRDNDPPSARTRSRSVARASSSANTPETRARRRAASSTRGGSEAPSVSSSAAQPRRTSGRTSTALAKPASTTRGSAVPCLASASRVTPRGRTAVKGKGKARARPVDSDMSMSLSVDGSWDVDSSVSQMRRNVKRRRISPPRLSLRLDLDGPERDDEYDSQNTAVGDDFSMLEAPDALPWIPVNPLCKDSAFVPPGVNALIEDMKRALVVHRSERERAESRYTEELQRRRELEQETARLAAANRALEAERSAWTAAAADSLASSLEDALISDMARKLTEEVFPSLKVSMRPGSEPFPPPQSRLEPGPSASARLASPGPGKVPLAAGTDIEMSDAYTQRPSPGAGQERGLHARHAGPSEFPPQPVHNSPHDENGTIPSEA